MPPSRRERDAIHVFLHALRLWYTDRLKREWPELTSVPHVVALQRLGISEAWIAARGLQLVQQAEILEAAEVDDGRREHLLVPEAAAAWRKLKCAAQNDGMTLRIVSAYRSVERQVEIIQRKLDAARAIEEILAVSAPLAYSEHHTGRAVDISSSDTPALEVSFADTPAFQWLKRHACEFGFFLSYPVDNEYGYEFEPWHWCYDKRARRDR